MARTYGESLLRVIVGFGGWLGNDPASPGVNAPPPCAL